MLTAKVRVIYALSAILLAAQTLAAAHVSRTQPICQPRVAAAIARIPVGSGIAVHTLTGETVRGQLVAREGSDIEVLPSGQESPRSCKCEEVKSVREERPERKNREWIGTAAMVGGFLAAAGLCAAMAGTIW